MSTRRLGVAVAVLGGFLYAVGGSDGTSPLNTGMPFAASHCCQHLSWSCLLSLMSPDGSWISWWLVSCMFYPSDGILLCGNSYMVNIWACEPPLPLCVCTCGFSIRCCIWHGNGDHFVALPTHSWVKMLYLIDWLHRIGNGREKQALYGRKALEWQNNPVHPVFPVWTLQYLYRLSSALGADIKVLTSAACQPCSQQYINFLCSGTIQSSGEPLAYDCTHGDEEEAPGLCSVPRHDICCGRQRWYDGA